MFKHSHSNCFSFWLQRGILECLSTIAVGIASQTLHRKYLSAEEQMLAYAECVCFMNAFYSLRKEKKAISTLNVALGYVKVPFLDFCLCYCSSGIPQRVPPFIHPSHKLGSNARILIIAPLLSCSPPNKPRIPGSPIAHSSHQCTVTLQATASH